MKAFWENLFFDLENGNLDKETLALLAGNTIRDDLRRIGDAIRHFNGQKALDIIDELKQGY